MLSGRNNINNRFARNYMNGRMGLRSIKKAPIRSDIRPKTEAICGVDDRVRTGDPQNHNLML
jgi:hypothetical protein